MLCSNCKILMIDPYLSECENIFCNKCKDTITICPIDNEKISNFLLRKPLKKKIEDIELKCPCICFDVDGVLRKGNQILPGAKESIERLK